LDQCDYNALIFAVQNFIKAHANIVAQKPQHVKTVLLGQNIFALDHVDTSISLGFGDLVSIAPSQNQTAVVHKPGT